MLRFRPLTSERGPEFTITSADTGRDLTEREYFVQLRDVYNTRNPHAIIEELDEDNDTSAS
jgi:hypothetical protein